MPGLQRRNDEWDNINVDNSDSDTDSDGRVVRVYRGDTSDDEATPDECRWLGDDPHQRRGARCDKDGHEEHV